MVSGCQGWWMGQYVISLWWHKHFEKHTIQSFIPACRSNEKPDSTVMYPGFTLQVPTGQSCWLTSMRGALSVTSQAFHYKNAWLLRYHKNDGECSCLAADWVKKETGFRTDRLCKGYKVNLDTVIFVSPLSSWIVVLLTVMWHGSSSNVSQRNKMGHERFGFAQRRHCRSTTRLVLCGEIPWGVVKWYEWLDSSSYSNDKSRNGLALVTQLRNWWRGSVVWRLWHGPRAGLMWSGHRPI